MKAIEPGSVSQAQKQMLKETRMAFSSVPRLVRKMANSSIAAIELDDGMLAKQWDARL
jgi:hypothetical protein